MPRPKKHLVDLYRGLGHSGTRRGFLRLDMNESVEGLPAEFIREVLSGVVPEDFATYPEYAGVTAKIALSAGLAPENVLVTNGSDAAIKHLFEAFVEPGDRVLFTDPTFAMYSVYAKIYRAVEVSTPYRHDLSFPFEEFKEDVATHHPKMAVVVNPNNPTGSRVEQPAIRALAEVCRTHDCLLVVDEAYFHYLEETAVALLAEFDNVVVFRTFSKLGGLAGLRIGYALAHHKVITAMGKVKSTFDVNCLAVAMAEALLAQPEILDRQLASVAQGREWLLQQLKAAELAYIAGHANFVLIDCGERCQEIAESLKKELILVGANFRQPFLQKYLRVTLAGIEVMQEFWSTFAHYVFDGKEPGK